MTSSSTSSRFLRFSALSGPLLLFALQLGHVPAFAPERKAARSALQESRHWREVAAQTAAVIDQKALEKAVAKGLEALRLSRVAHDAAGEAAAGVHLGEMYGWRGEIPRAVAAFKGALECATAAGDRRGQAAALRAWGALRAGLEEWQPALQLLRQALLLGQEIGDPAEQGRTLYLIGVVHAYQGESDRALEYYQAALPLARGPGTPEADLLNAIGAIFLRRGHNERALDHYRRALELSVERRDRPVEAAVRQGLGSLYQRLGDLQTAYESYSRALLLNQRLRDVQSQGKVLNSLGALYRDMGDPGKAEEHYARALKVLPAEAVGDRAEAFFQRGRVHYLEGDLEEARVDFEQALALGPSRRASALFGLGLVRRSLESPAAGLPLLEEALALRRKSEDRLQEASVLVEIGRTYQLMGTGEKARSFLQQALDISRRVEGSLVEAAALFRTAQLERDQGNLDAATRTIGEAIQLGDSTRAKLLTDRLRSSFFASRREQHELAIDLQMRLAERHPAAGHEAEAFLASERARGRGLLDLMAEGRVGAGRDLPRALRDQEVEIDARLSQVQNLLIEELSAERPDAGRVEALRRELRDTEEQRQNLEVRIRREHRRYAQVRYGEPLPLATVQALLDGETALLEYVLGEEVSYLFVVTREGLTTHRLPPAREIAGLVRRARAGLETTHPRRFRGYVTAARGLYNRLVAPARGALSGKRHLLVAADRSLHLLAFETLLRGDAGDRGNAGDVGEVAGRPAHDLPYLVRDYAVTYVPSATVWAELMEARRQRPAPSAAAKRLLAVADPLDLATPKGSGGRRERGTRAGQGILAADRWRWGRLPGSGEEVRRISGLYPRGTVAVYTGADATEENLKASRWLSGARRIHFATHGHVSEAQPELSALQLTRAKGSKEDGLLQAHEIFDLRLDAELVVLSACETALGKQVTGEGLMGLTRAFLYAGAGSVVVSLWPVADDFATPDLMVSFYRGLDRSRDATRGKAEALHAAKLELIRKKQYAHPYYWAPFILVGEPE